MKTLTSFGMKLFSILLVLTLVGNVAALDSGDDIVEGFVTHIESLSMDDDLKDAAKTIVSELRADEYGKSEAVTAGLAKLYPKYDAALQASVDFESAMAQLTSFTSSDDKYLAADASFFLARTMMNEQRYEDALPLLETLSGDLADYSLYTGPAVYFSGVAQASLLENQRAITSFQRFLEDFEDAPERLRVAAVQQAQAIMAVEEGKMTDVLQRMDFSRRRLEIENTDEYTQEQQQNITSMLAKLIKEQEKKECSNCNSKKNCEGQQESQAKSQGEGQGEGQGKSNAGGTSNNPDGVAKRTYQDGPASPWSQLRDRTRDAANNAAKQRLPARYRGVVEGYYDKTSGNEDDK